jgi:predicted nuclease with TOPRIM domain
MSFGFYLSFGESRKWKWEREKRSLTISFWRITVCFASVDIERLFESVFAKFRERSELRTENQELETRLKELEENNRKGVEQEVKLHDEITKLEQRNDDLDDEVTDLQCEREELQKTVNKLTCDMDDMLRYFYLDW